MPNDLEAATVAFQMCGECRDRYEHWTRLSDYAKDFYRNGGVGEVPPPDNIDELMAKNFGASPA